MAPLFIDESEGELSFGRELAAYFGLALGLARAPADFKHVDVELKHIAGRDRMAEFRRIDAHEERQLVGKFGFGEKKSASSLRERLDDQHAGHDGFAGKMSLEEPLIHG